MEDLPDASVHIQWMNISEVLGSSATQTAFPPSWSMIQRVDGDCEVSAMKWRGTFAALGSIASRPEHSVGINFESIADIVGDFRCSLRQLSFFTVFNYKALTVEVRHKTRSALTSLANLATAIICQHQCQVAISRE